MLYWIIGVILVIFLFIASVIFFIEGNADYWAKKGIKTVYIGQYLPFSERYSFKVPFHEIELRLYNEFKKMGTKIGGSVFFRHPSLFINDVEIIKNILVKDFDHFINRKNIDIRDKKFDLMLVNMMNQEWKDLRATMSPAFSSGKIKRMFGIFNESGRKMVEYLKSESSKNNEIDVKTICGKYTMDVIASTAFGLDTQNFSEQDSPFVKFGKLLQEPKITFFLILKFIFVMSMPGIAKYFEFSFSDPTAVNFLEGIIKDSIKRRKDGQEKREDFLQLMLEARDEVNSSEENNSEENGHENDFMKGKSKSVAITDDVIFAQSTLFFFGGFDTMETLLMYGTYELALNSEIQEKLYKSLVEGVAKNGGELTYEFVNQAEYLDMVVSETLRKYPPGVRLERKCNKDYEIPSEGLIIKKDTHVIMQVMCLHHDPELYPNPTKFDPERFSQENKASRHPYAYLPFGVGPRACIASRFALTEGKVALAHLVLNFKFSPSTKTHIPMKFSPKGILKPLDGVWLKVEERK